MLQNKLKLISLFLIFSTFSSFISLAEVAPDNEKKEEEKVLTPEEVHNLQIEKKAREDFNNYHYYPKIELGTTNLFGGATTLKQNEIFARAFASFLLNRGLLDTNGSQITGGLANHLQGGLQIGWGVLDNLLFTASVPAKYYFTGSPGLSDAWLNLKYRFIDNPFNLSLQVEGKIPSGSVTSIPPLGTGDLNIGAMALITKSFEPVLPLFIQAGAGYRYRSFFQTLVNNQLVDNKYSDQINYALNAGWNFQSTGWMGDITAYGYYPMGQATSVNNISYNFLTVKPNITYKFNNMEGNFSVDIPLIGRNIDNPISFNAGVTIKNSFEYSRIFSLMFAKKIDAETINNKSDFTQVNKGKELYLNTCSKCHALIDPDIYTYEKWELVVDRYKDRKILTKQEHSAIIDFLKVYKK